MSVEILGKTYPIDETPTLSLSNKDLTVFSTEICKLINLQYLNLSENQITTIPSGIGKLINLKYLFLHNNQIIYIPPEIANLINLVKLYLNNNQITNVPLELLKIKEKLSIDVTAYDINNLDPDCEIIILNNLEIPLANLPNCLKEIWLLYSKIDIDQLKIPFGCKVYVDDILKN
jgi:Leucine-rich repeat (LRR) protein